MGGPIYTREGDGGETSLVGGARVPKDSARVRAVGAVDEANSCLGLARVAVSDPLLDATLSFAQNRLMSCASLLAVDPTAPLEPGATVSAEDTASLESLTDLLSARTGPVERFVLPGGCEAAARLHLARATVRRAEREVVALGGEGRFDPAVGAFLNRLSDLLFAAARYANHLEGSGESFWDAAADPPRET